jgi:hypothetical protein
MFPRHPCPDERKEAPDRAVEDIVGEVALGVPARGQIPGARLELEDLAIEVGSRPHHF